MLTNVDHSRARAPHAGVTWDNTSPLICLEESAIQNIKALIAVEHVKPDDLAWMLANMGVTIGHAIVPRDLGGCGRLPRSVTIAPDLYTKVILDDEVSCAHREIAKENLPVEELLYRLAQRFYLLHFLEKK